MYIYVYIYIYIGQIFSYARERQHQELLTVLRYPDYMYILFHSYWPIIVYKPTKLYIYIYIYIYIYQLHKES